MSESAPVPEPIDGGKTRGRYKSLYSHHFLTDAEHDTHRALSKRASPYQAAAMAYNAAKKAEKEKGSPAAAKAAEARVIRYANKLTRGVHRGHFDEEVEMAAKQTRNAALKAKREPTEARVAAVVRKARVTLAKAMSKTKGLMGADHTTGARCSPGKRFNSETGRCRAVSSPARGRSRSPCPPGKFRSSSTGRCRMRKSRSRSRGKNGGEGEEAPIESA